jgi:hypothetical protein
MKVKVKQSLEWPRLFQEVKVPRFNITGTGWFGWTAFET